VTNHQSWRDVCTTIDRRFPVCWQKIDRLFFLFAFENPSSRRLCIIVTIAVSDGSLQLEREMPIACPTFCRLLTRSILSALSVSFRLIAKPVRTVSEHGVAGAPSDGLSDSQLRTLLLKSKKISVVSVVWRFEVAMNGSVVSTILHNTFSYRIHEDRFECPSRYFIVVS